MKSTSSEVPHYAVFSFPVIPLPFDQVFSALFFNILNVNTFFPWAARKRSGIDQCSNFIVVWYKLLISFFKLEVITWNVLFNYILIWARYMAYIWNESCSVEWHRFSSQSLWAWVCFHFTVRVYALSLCCVAWFLRGVELFQQWSRNASTVLIWLANPKKSRQHSFIAARQKGICKPFSSSSPYQLQ